MTATHTFAWNGVSFEIPADWNLSSHHTFRGVTTVAMEDDVARRLDLEWTRPRNDLDLATVRKRFTAASKNVGAAAETTTPVRGLPEGWSAVSYRMPEGREWTIAFYLPPDKRLVCFFQFHAMRDAVPRSPAALKAVASSLRAHDGPAIPWRFYDVAFALDKAFTLSTSSLRAGNKLLVFEWRMRRLFVWHVSLADAILRKTSIRDWTVDHLNRFAPLQAVTFRASDTGAIRAARKWRYPFGRYEEIGRQCFTYHAEYRHIPERNQIAIWVYQYRRPEDLALVRNGFCLLKQ